MEAATERINSASWRETNQYSIDTHPPIPRRSECGIVGFGTKILHQPVRYYNSQSGLAQTQNGMQGKSVSFVLMDGISVAEYITTQTELIPESYSLVKSEVPLAQIKNEANLSPATFSASLKGEILSLNDGSCLEEQVLVKSERASPLNPCSVKSEDSVQSVIKSPGLTTELENFQDLTDWCHSTPKALKMSVPLETDELNTPIIDFGDFVFQSPTIGQTNDDYYDLLNVASECTSPEGLYTIEASDIQINNYDNNNIDSQLLGNTNINCINKSEATYQYILNDIGGGEVEKNIKKSTLMNSYNIITDCADSIYNSEISVPSTNNTKSMDSLVSTGLISHETSQDSSSATVFTTLNRPPVFELETNKTPINIKDVVILPLDSTPQTEVTTNKKKNLQLDFSNIWTTEKILTPTVLDTPEVINTALAMDKSFNLINFINEMKTTEVSTNNIQATKLQCDDEQSTSTINDPDPSYSPSEASDDEEYEPPWKKQKKITSRSVKTKLKRGRPKSIIDNSDSEISNVSSIEPALKVIKRGRPPKRNISISSESTNADTEVSRYRELRDKNNEASRRSRLNRKMKELHLEEEAKDLDDRNRKLKVRVQELERLVTTMRNNLMQMLLKK